MRICLSCQPTNRTTNWKTTTKNLLYNRWLSHRLESHCHRKDTHHTTFWKGCKECSKRLKTKDNSSTNISEAKEGSNRRNSRNASHHSPRTGRNCKICKYLVSQKVISSNQSNNVVSFTTGRAKGTETDCNIPDWGHFLHHEVNKIIISKTSRDRCPADWAKKRQYPQTKRTG